MSKAQTKESLLERIEELEVQLRLFRGAAYPVATEIDPRGYRWSDPYLDQSLRNSNPENVRKQPKNLEASRVVDLGRYAGTYGGYTDIVSDGGMDPRDRKPVENIRASTGLCSKCGGEDIVAAERERLCAAIKAEDDHCAGGDYMMDSDDCIKVIRGTWERPNWG